MAAIPRYRPFEGPALFRQGFRPFFLAAGSWALVVIALWVPAFQGLLFIPTAFGPLGWHAHEMIFGFVAAAVAGFLLTAIPNWTGRMPLQGAPLAILFALWIAGRLAVGISEVIGAGPAAALDLAFLAVLLAAALREILAGRNWRNLPVTIALGGLLLANLLVHAEFAGLHGSTGLGLRLGIAIVIALISLIGGRIIPSFTLNWLKKRGAISLPAGFNAFDRICLVVLVLALAAWVAFPESPVSGAALLLAGLASLARLVRWRGHLTLAEPLVWSLHLGFLWVPLGLVLTGLGVFLPALPATAGLHALTAGAMASMILAVMTRATLGHTGRPLTADRWTAALYVLIAMAAALRVAAPVLPALYLPLIWVSAASWIAAFAIFTIRYGRMLLGR